MKGHFVCFVFEHGRVFHGGVEEAVFGVIVAAENHVPRAVLPRALNWYPQAAVGS